MSHRRTAPARIIRKARADNAMALSCYLFPVALMLAMVGGSCGPIVTGVRATIAYGCFYSAIAATGAAVLALLASYILSAGVR